MDQILFLVGSAVFGLLGTLHLVYTLFTNKFDARDPSVIEKMKSSSIVLSREINLWNAWIGFNASHSLGAILFAAVYLPLALNHLAMLRESIWFSTLPVVFGTFYLLLAKKYWFRVPFLGILVATLCFLGAAIITNA